MLHGEPSWSFLYRKMIPIVAAANTRVIAPDLIGFGKSDKFAEAEKYTYAMHVESITALIENLDLKNITLVCQDWGGLIGLRIAAENPERFSRIVAANTFLPTGDEDFPAAFKIWLAMSQASPFFPVGKIVKMGCKTKLVNAKSRRLTTRLFQTKLIKSAQEFFRRLCLSRPIIRLRKRIERRGKFCENGKNLF